MCSDVRLVVDNVRLVISEKRKKMTLFDVINFSYINRLVRTTQALRYFFISIIKHKIMIYVIFNTFYATSRIPEDFNIVRFKNQRTCEVI